MKNLYLVVSVVILFCIHAPCQSQTWQSNCSSDSISEMLFRQDINKLLLNRLFTTNSPYKDSIQLPTLERDSIARVLYAIYHMQPSAVKDTIMTNFGYNPFWVSYTNIGLPKEDSSHIYPSILLRYLFRGSTKYISLLAPLTAGSVGAAWKAGNFTNTPDTALNTLIIKYKIKITFKPDFGTNFILEFSNLNPYALLKELKKSSGINSNSLSIPYGFGGSGNEISLSFDSAGANIQYFLGCGDCPVGCTYSDDWSFRVNSFSNCAVTYLGSYYGREGGGFGPPTYCGGPVVTPVDFVSVSGQLKENYPSLKWSVANEINIHHYEIEQSPTGKSDFVVTDFVPVSKGSGLKNYQWQSTKPLLQTSFYRVKAVEQTGKSFYSTLLQINPMNTKEWASIYPNPIKNRTMQLSINKAEASTCQMVIYSLSGNLVFQKLIATNGVQQLQAVQLPKSIAPGVYSVQLISPIGGRIFQQKVTIE